MKERYKKHDKNKMICFDLEGVLVSGLEKEGVVIRTNSYTLLSKFSGKESENQRLLEQFLKDKISQEKYVLNSVALWKGLPVEKLNEIIPYLRFTTNAKLVCDYLSQHGYNLSTISNGFSFITNSVATTLGLKYAVSNKLEVKNKKLTGRIEYGLIFKNEKKEIEKINPLIKSGSKVYALKLLLKKEELNPSNVIVFGDYPNDIEIMRFVKDSHGVGIAFNAVEQVKKIASLSIDSNDLKIILEYIKQW
ncbi:HAD family phosphatase [Patescibacteria group bacterium]|nr:HAD family phosphatase [Patescibacteria group bacterium]